ncbi:hypothetical protein Plhal304r1_c033g0104911 [Plasmopara halstedii]
MNIKMLCSNILSCIVCKHNGTKLSSKIRVAMACSWLRPLSIASTQDCLRKQAKRHVMGFC